MQTLSTRLGRPCRVSRRTFGGRNGGKIYGMVGLQRESMLYRRPPASPWFCSTHLVLELFESPDLSPLTRERNDAPQQ